MSPWLGKILKLLMLRLKKTHFLMEKLRMYLFTHTATQNSLEIYIIASRSHLFILSHGIQFSLQQKGGTIGSFISQQSSPPPELILEVGQFYCIFKLQKLCCCTPFRGFHPQYISYFLTYALFNSYHMHALTL